MTDDSLMARNAVLVHVGPFKTGSSAIQAALANARPRLSEHGVVYPGRGTRDRRAGWAVLESMPRGRNAPRMEEWEALVAEVHAAADKRVCISNEDFGRAGPSYTARIIEDLDRDRVHAVIVARRLDKLLPSQWQERVRCYETLTYGEFLRVVLEDQQRTHPAAKAFWQSHDMGAVIDRWASQIGPKRVTVIVTEGADRDLLPRTFEQMLGLPPGLLELDSRSNPSVSYNAIELYRRVNEAFAEHGWSDYVYHHVMQNGVNRSLQEVAPSSDLRMPPLPDWAPDRVRELSVQRVEAIRDRGVNVVGSLDALLPKELPTISAEELPEQVSIDAAVKAVEGAVRGALALQTRARKGKPGKPRQQEPAKQRKARRPSSTQGSRSVEETPGRELLAILAGRAARRASWVTGRRRS